MKVMTFVRSAAVALALVLAPAVPVMAQQPQAAQDQYVPVDQLQQVEEFPATPLVAGAYGVAWAAVLVWVWMVWTRLQKVDRELAEVSRRLPGAKR